VTAHVKPGVGYFLTASSETYPTRRRRDGRSIGWAAAFINRHEINRRSSAFRRTHSVSSTISRRITALVCALLLLQLTLAGGSAACGLHARGADTAAGKHQGMSMASAAASASKQSRSGVASDAASRQLGAGVEWRGAVPNDSRCPTHGTDGPCESMTACTPVVLGTAMAGASVVAANAARAIPSRVLTPPTRTTAPELPPPRS